MHFTKSTHLLHGCRKEIFKCISADKQAFGASAANNPTETKLIGASQTFWQPGNNFRPQQTLRRDFRDQGCLLPSAAPAWKELSS